MRIFTRKTMTAGVLVAALGGGSLLSSGVASAQVPAGYTGVGVIAVGSNTTEDVTAAVANDYNAAQTVNYVSNISANPTTPQLAATDGACNGGVNQTYTSSPAPPGDLVAPNGSGAGKLALASSVANNDSCVSVARSSSPPDPTNAKGTDPAGTHAIAFGLDVVSWAAKKGGDAPANLTQDQLEGIYNCSITDWSQVGGKAGPIQRYFPQAGSGTRSFFQQYDLGGQDPTLVSSPSCPAVILIEENEATQITTPAAQAIMPYAASKWVAQANMVSPEGDLRNGFTMRKINGHSIVSHSSTTGLYSLNRTTVKAANVEPDTTNDVVGVRFVYNFLNTNSVDYAAAKDFVGLSSALCNGGEAANVQKFGFVPVKGLTTGSTCLDKGV